ncbi:hypothetical protein JHK82_021949 [Glycine max]|nr:hypothetical protein JHK85_022416 [Glycine max]KAG5026050.1 hypothetical protein JHK86_021964 [Glycine max]KAG5137218.1 hypothetical protein JHK82_021949 [Glycine max]
MLADIDRFLFENFKSLFLNDLEEPANRVEKSPELGPMPSGSSSATSESEIAEEQTVIPGNCVVVLANSVNPSKDFQRSMESVVEASAFVDVVIAMRSPSDIAPVKLRTVRIGRKVQKKTRKQLPWNLGRHHKLLVGGRVFNLRRKS